MRVERTTWLSTVFILAIVLLHARAFGSEVEPRDKPPDTDGPQAQHEKPKAAAKKAIKKTSKDDRSETASNVIPAPRGPVRVVHIDGTDLFVIAGQEFSRKPNTRAPSVIGTVEIIPELNLVIIRSSTE